jgi:hypothetical protein
LASATHRGGSIVDSAQFLSRQSSYFSSYSGETNQYYYCNASSHKKWIGYSRAFSKSNNLTDDNRHQVDGGHVVSQEGLDKQQEILRRASENLSLKASL